MDTWKYVSISFLLEYAPFLSASLKSNRINIYKDLGGNRGGGNPRNVLKENPQIDSDPSVHCSILYIVKIMQSVNIHQGNLFNGFNMCSFCYQNRDTQNMTSHS